jgi:hemolysin activation/secretion protein
VKSILKSACATGLVLSSGAAYAQTVPAQIDPGRVQEQVRPPEVPRPAPELTVPEIPAALAPADAERIKVQVSEVRIEGSTVYGAAELEAMAAGIKGREISLVEAFKLADAITARYRRDDYILSRAVVPAQRLENGVLRLQIVEGYVSEVAFEGTASKLQRKYAAELTAEKPLRGKVLERYLLLMNDLPGARARAVLAPAPDALGGSKITIVSSQKPIDAYAGFDNHGSRYIGPFEYYAGVSANNQLGLGERIGLSYAGAAPTSELAYVSGQIDLPLNADGLLLTANAGYSDSHPGFVLKDLDARATGTTLGLALSYPVIRSRAGTLRLNLDFHYLNSRTVMNGQPDLAPSSNDHVRAFRLGANYDFADRAGGHNIVEVELSRGVGGLDERRPNPSRPGAENDFRKLTVEISRRQTLDQITPGLALYGVFLAQTSFGDRLFSSEQFGVGGSTIGTGYDPSEITGDSGVAGRGEVQYSFGMRQIRGAGQAYGFYDIGTAHNGVIQPGEQHNRSISSAGAGLRFSLLDHVSGYVEVAKPLTRDVQAQLLAKQEGKPTRVFFGLNFRY